MSKNSKDIEIMRRRGLSEPATAPSSRPGRAHSIGGNADGSDGTVHTDHSSEPVTTEGSDETGDNTENAAGGQGQKSMTSKAIFLTEKEQKSDGYSLVPDDPFHVVVRFGNKGSSSDVTETALDLGQSVWHHLKQSEECMAGLEEELKKEFINFSQENVSGDKVVLHCIYFHCVYRKEIVEKVKSIFQEASKKFHRYILQVSDNIKYSFFQKWPETQLHKKRMATVHRNRNGEYIVVCSRECQKLVDEKMEKLLLHCRQTSEEDIQRVEGGKQTPLHMTDTQAEALTTDSRWNPIDTFLESDKETVKVMMQATIPIDDPLLEFLQKKKEAGDYIVTCFQEMDIECKFDLIAKEVLLTADKPCSIDDTILNRFVVITTVPFSCGKIHDFFTLDELTEILQQHLPSHSGKFMLIPSSDNEDSLIIVATNDADEDVKNKLKMVENDGEENFIEVSEEDFMNLLQQNQWKNMECKALTMECGKVSVQPFQRDGTYGLFVRGTKANVSKYRRDMKNELFRSKNDVSIILSEDEKLLLQNNAKVAEYVIEAGKDKGFEFKIVDSGSVQLSCSEQTYTEGVEFFHSLFSKETISQEGERMFDSLNTVELKEMLMEEVEIHQGKLLIDLNDTSDKVKIIGTHDIFPGVLKRLKDINQLYKKGERFFPLVQKHMGHIYGIAYPELQAFIDSPRMKVQVVPLSVNDQPGVKVTGSKFGLAKFEQWLKSTCGTVRDTTARVVETECTLKHQEENTAFETMALSGHLQKLLKTSAPARAYIKQSYEERGFKIEYDAEYKNAVLRARTKQELARAREHLSTCTERETVSFDSENKYLNPKRTKSILEEKEPERTSQMIVYINGQQNTLMLIGTKDVAVPVIDALHKLLHEYKEECVVLFLTKEEISELSVNTGLLKQSEGVKPELSSEKLQLVGAKIEVEKRFESVCEFILSLSKSTRRSIGSHMRMCEQNVSSLVYSALEDNDSIWEYVTKRCVDCGFGLELLDRKLRLYAASITALQQFRSFFPSLIFEKKFCLLDEPVVDVKGMKYVMERCKNSTYGGKVMVHQEDDSCTLTIVCTDDLLPAVETDLEEIKNGYQQKSLGIDEGVLEKIDCKAIEKELLDNEPKFKDKFALALKDGRLKITAARDCIELLKMKAESFLRWREREVQINKSNHRRDLNLTDLQCEFVQQPEVIDYIDETLVNFQFEIDRKSKVLSLYAIKDNLFSDGIKKFWDCIIEKKVDLSDDPVLENLTLETFKQMLDAQGALHHGKLHVHIDEKRKLLILVFTDDIREVICQKIGEIKKQCSDVTDFIPCQLGKWVAVKTLYPEELHKIEKTTVRIDYNPTGGNIEVIGHRQPVNAALKKLKEVMQKMVSEAVPLHGNDSDVLQTEEGQTLIRRVQKENCCTVALQEVDRDLPQEMVDRKYLAGLQLKLSPHTCVRLSQWTSESGSSVAVIQGRMEDLVADILAIPVVNGCLPASVHERITKDGVYSEVQSKMKNISSTKNNITLKHPVWCKCQSVMFFWMPASLKDGKNQEKNTVHRNIKEMLRSGVPKERSLSAVFMLESLWQSPGNLLRAGTKCIIRGSQEAFNAEKQLSLDVCLLTDEHNSSTVMNILQQGCPSSKNFSFKKTMKKMKNKLTFSNKENAGGCSRPKIKVVVGELQKQKADVLVNSAHTSLNLSHGIVSQILNESSQGGLQKQCKKQYPSGIRYGEVAVTNTSGDLTSRCKMVFHGALCSYKRRHMPKEPNEQECWETMGSFIYRCMHEASKRHMESIAFPVLGTGTLEYPAERVVKVMFNTVEWFFSVNPLSSVSMVQFVVYDLDAPNIKLFKAEQMARSYQVNSFLSEGPSHQEARMDRENGIMLQIIENDVNFCEGSSDGMLCFWQENQMNDPDRHPFVGEHLKSVDWPSYEPDLKKHGLTKTGGGALPATILFHVLVYKKDLLGAVQRGLKSAGENKMSTLQIPLLPQDVNSDDLRTFASGLLKILKEASTAEGPLSLVTLVVQDPHFFKSMVYHLSEVSKSSSFWRLFTDLASYFTESKPTAEDKHVADDSIESDETVKAVVYAKTRDDCKKACDCLQNETRKMNQKENHRDPRNKADGSSVDGEEFFNAQKGENKTSEVDTKVFTYCEAQLSSKASRYASLDSMKQPLVKCNVHLKDQNGKLYLTGDFENVTRAYDILCDVGNFNPRSATADKGKPKHTKEAYCIKNDHFSAILHLIGADKVHQFCYIEDSPPLNKKVYFILDPANPPEDMEQRIRGVIQEEVKIPEPDRGKAKAGLEAAMANSSDMYIQYQDDKHTAVVFAEDWEKMAKAKKKIQLQFGQAKTSTRGGRRFVAESKKSEPEMFTGTKNKATETFDKGNYAFEGKQIIVKVYIADITRLDVDVIVNAANGYLSHGAGVAKSIAEAGGPDLIRESNDYVQRHGEIPVTELAVTTAGRLQFKKIFHAVGPQWHSYNNKQQCQDDLCYTILRCLCEAEKRKMKTIAIPSISAAIFRVPQDLCAKMYVRALKSFDQAVEGGFLKEVHFVDISEKMVDIIRRELVISWNQPGKQMELQAEREFIDMRLGDTTKGSMQHQGTTQTSTIPEILNHVDFSVEDLSKVQADALVSWEDFTFSKNRPLVRQMIRTGGRRLEDDRQSASYKCSKIGDVAFGGGGNLHVTSVIYASLPSLTKPEELADIISRILQMSSFAKRIIIPIMLNILTVGETKDPKMLFIGCLIKALLEYEKVEKGEEKEIIVLGEDRNLMEELKQKYFENLTTISLPNEDCVICYEMITKPSKLKCGHVFCEPCISRALKDKPVCPVCKHVCGIVTGTMPKGTMTVNMTKKGLPGYESCGTIEITYSFDSGYQTAQHPNPGKWYKGITRKALLPDNAEGEKVLALLKIAFERQLTFTIGRSVTMDIDGCITWNEIHHKTNVNGGPENHGYPDSGYLSRVTEELASQGVTEEDLK